MINEIEDEMRMKVSFEIIAAWKSDLLKSQKTEVVSVTLQFFPTTPLDTFLISCFEVWAQYDQTELIKKNQPPNKRPYSRDLKSRMFEIQILLTQAFHSKLVQAI